MSQTILQNCGNCLHHRDMEMSQGELTEVRCQHPAVQAATMQEEVPDWLIDLNSFRPTQHGHQCSAWKYEHDADGRLTKLEMQIRQDVPELGCLSFMGLHFLEQAFAYLTEDRQSTPPTRPF